MLAADRMAARSTAPASPWPVFWVASVATFLVSLDTTMLFAAFDALRRAFGDASAAQLSWVLNGYTVVYAAMLIPAGGLADQHGRKRVFRFGVALFLAASAAWRRRSARVPAASSSTASAGPGPSSSTCRSAAWRCGAAARCSKSRPGRPSGAASTAWGWRC